MLFFGWSAFFVCVFFILLLGGGRFSWVTPGFAFKTHSWEAGKTYNMPGIKPEQGQCPTSYAISPAHGLYFGTGEIPMLTNTYVRAWGYVWNFQLSYFIVTVLKYSGLNCYLRKISLKYPTKGLEIAWDI